jgi:glutaredoxin
MDGYINDYAVFMVSKRGCPFCSTAKRVIEEYDIPAEKYKVLEIDGDKDGNEIQKYMHTLTGGRTVHKYFIRD